MTPLDLTVHRGDDGAATTLVATGEIDLSNVDRFGSALDAATGTVATARPAAGSGDAAQPVTVDLRAVDYLDSGALTVLFGHAGRIRIVAGPLLMPVLTISGLASLVPVGADAGKHPRSS